MRPRRAIEWAGVLCLVGLCGTSAALAEWIPLGPTPARDGQIENVVPDNQISGGIHVVLPHPTDADTLYLGTVNGGVWRTTNATATRPLWYPLTSGFPGSIGALQFDPTDSSSMTLVAAYGQFSSYFVGGPLNGLLRSIDGGATWNSLSDPLLDGNSLTGVAARGSILVATASPQFSYGSGGLFRSIDTGASWAQIDGSAGLAAAIVGFTDLVGDPAAASRLYTANRADAVYRSDDTGANWVDISSGDAGLSAAVGSGANNNTEMAVGPGGRLWVSVHLGGSPGYIGYTDNPTSATPTWVEMDLPLTLEGGGAIGNASVSTPIVISTARAEIMDASNTTPIVITSVGHGLATNDNVLVDDVMGNVAANGDWFINVLDADSFELFGSVGDGAYTAGGTWMQFHNLGSGEQVEIAGVTGNLAANGLFTITVVDDFSFELDGSAGAGAYTGGGIWSRVEPANPTHPGSQGFIHSSIVAHPVNPDLIFIGGDRQPAPFPNTIGANNYSGRLFRGDASMPTGAVPSPQWDHLTHDDNVAGMPGGGTAGSSSPHADSREMAFDAGGELIETSDGGIYRRTSPTDNTGDWFSINGSLHITEMHNIIYDTLSDVALAGTQDNGNVEQPSAGALEWAHVLGGDGGDVAVDATSTPGMSIRYRSAQFLLAFVRDFYDASGTFVMREFPARNITDGSVAFWPFTTPFELNKVDPTRIAIGASNHVYESLDQGDTMTTADPFDAGTPNVGIGANWDAIAYGGYQSGVPNVDVLYFGSDAEVYVRTAAAPAAPVTTCWSYGFVRDLVLDPDDWSTAYVLANHTVREMTGSGTTCTDIGGDLYGFTNRRMNRIEYIEGSPGRIVVSGNFDGVTDVKVMDVTVPGSWTSLGPGLPGTLLYELDYDAADDVLVAGTMGRGAWVFDVSCSPGGETSWYRDVDGDGFGDGIFSVSACTMPGGFVADNSDCSDGDATLWNAPGETPALLFGPAKDRLSWSEPLAPGGLAGTTLYDAIRSSDPTDFTTGAVCVESDDGSDREATDAFIPGPGGVAFYLIRAENPCGAGGVGDGNAGGTPTPRSAQDCPV